MNDSRRKALRRYHQDLRTHITVNDFLPSLHVDADGFLTDLESGKIRKCTGNIEQVDELIEILVTKENNDFDHFCVALEEGYHVWSAKLRETAGLERELTDESVKGGRMLRKRPSFSKEVEASQDPANCATSSTVRPSVHHNPSRPSDKQERVLQPSPSTTIKLPSMAMDLKVISCVLLNNKVYISGIGTDDVPKSRQVQVYSIKDNTWSTLPKAPNHNAPIAIVHDHITLIGGRDVETNKPSNVVSTWFEKENMWKQSLHSLPTVSVASKAYHHENLFLVTGGAEESIVEGEGENLTVVEKVHVYNFSSKKWTTPQQLRLPKPLCSHHLVHLGEYLYLLGGAIKFKDAAHTTPKDQIYNLNAWKARWADIEEAVQHQDLTVQPSQPEKSIWKSITDLPVFLPTVVLCGSSIISVGGMNNSSSNDSPVSAIYEFVDDKVNSQWVKVGDMSLGRYRHGVVPLGTRGAALLVAGGFKWGVSDEADVKTTSVELVLL